MTIKGFTEYLRSDKDLNVLIELNKSIVIFDGHLIQRRLNDMSSRSQEENTYCDYTSYAETIKRFFRRLKVCQIVAIIVFDGSINPSRYKSGFSERIKEIHQILKSGYHCKSQSPTLRNYVFTSVVHSFGVEIIQTCSNTWAQVVSLANKLKCPVYSQRKEFLFGGLENGLIDDSLLKSALHFTQTQKCWYLSVNVLRIDCLAKKFGGLKLEVMPLLGVLLENQFIDQNGYKGLSQEIKEWHKSDRIEVILNWIKGKSLDNCLQSITRYLRPDAFDDCQQKSEKLRQLLQKFKTNKNDSAIRQFLSESELEKESLKMLAKGDTDIVLPNWFVNDYQKGIIRPALMNVVKMKTHIVFPQIEDFSQPSSYECTQRLRRFLYGILRTEVEKPSPIKVLDRTTFTESEVVSTKEELVSPMIRLSDTLEVPNLLSVRQSDITDRRKLFLSVMEVNEAFINRCKLSLLLFEFFEDVNTIDGTTFLIIITRYIIRKNPQINLRPSIGALILSILFYSSPQLRSELKWINLSRIASEDRFKPQFIQFFAQIQACLHISNFINTVLGHPFEEGKPYFCLNGIYFYNATKCLSNGEEYDPYLKYLFRNQPKIGEIFDDIKHLIESDLCV